MNVARMCGGIIMIAGPELAPRVIWPRPKDFRPPDMISDCSESNNECEETVQE